METKENPERVLIHFREEKYNERLELYQKHLREVDSIKQYITRELEIEVDDIDLTDKDALNVISSRFAGKYEKQNTLGLKPYKLASLLEIDLEGALIKVDELVRDRHGKQFTEPKKEDYSTFAYDPESIELTKKCMKLKELLNEVGMNLQTGNPFEEPLRYNQNFELELSPAYFSGETDPRKPGS